MSKVPATRADMANVEAFIGKRFQKLPMEDQLAVWRLTDAQVLMARGGYVVKWEPPRRGSQRNPRRHKGG